MQELISRNEKCLSIAYESIENYRNKEFEFFSISFLAGSYCYRMANTLHSVNQLIPNISNKQFHSSIALVLRPSLLDLLTLGYTFHQFKELKDISLNAPMELIKSIYADSLGYLLSDLKTYKDVGTFTSEEYKSTLDLYYKQFEDLFQEYKFENNELHYRLKKFAKIPSTRKMYSSMKNSNHYFVREMANCYVEYAWFSKYEHFGLITLLLMGNKENDQFFQWINKSCRYIALGINTSLIILGKQSIELEKIIKKY